MHPSFRDGFEKTALTNKRIADAIKSRAKKSGAWSDLKAVDAAAKKDNPKGFADIKSYWKANKNKNVDVGSREHAGARDVIAQVQSGSIANTFKNAIPTKNMSQSTLTKGYDAFSKMKKPAQAAAAAPTVSPYKKYAPSAGINTLTDIRNNPALGNPKTPEKKWG